MKFKSTLTLIILLIALPLAELSAGQYFALCEGNFGQANATLWSFDENLSAIDGPLIWDTDTNPLGDVAQSLTLYDNKLYIIMNNSHTVRVLDLENGITPAGDIDMPGASPRFMAVQHSQERGFVSSWNLGGLLVIDLTTDEIIDTLSLGGLPEEMIIQGDKLYVSINLNSDWTANNQVIELDISTVMPSISRSFTVIDGPGSMVILNDTLYVTSIYYNASWESFTGTSSIDLATGTVLSVDHGAYANSTADIDLIDRTPYRVFGSSIVPLNGDLTLAQTGLIGNVSNIYSFSVQNDKVVVGTSDFVAPDEIVVFAPDGSSEASFTLGALPGDVLYYDPEAVAVDDRQQIPASLSLGSNFPNPFNPVTLIPFQLERPGQTRLVVFDAKGRLVNTLMNDFLAAGRYEIKWNGLSATGSSQASGVYFAVLSFNQETQVIKMNLLK